MTINCTKHTKSKWEAIFNESQSVWQVWPIKKGVGRICTILNRNKKEEKANAYLIAAAPDLLDACKQAVCGNMGWKGKLRQAIAKAESGG